VQGSERNMGFNVCEIRQKAEDAGKKNFVIGNYEQ